MAVGGMSRVRVIVTKGFRLRFVIQVPLHWCAGRDVHIVRVSIRWFDGVRVTVGKS